MGVIITKTGCYVPSFAIENEKFLQNSFLDENKEEIDEIEFNQDIENENGINSPGWLRYQKRIK